MCSACVGACPKCVAQPADGGVYVDDACDACGRCVTACPLGARQILGQRMSAQSILAVVERDRIFFRKSGGGVTFSGGEATCQPGLLRCLAQRLGGSGIHLALETCGQFSWSENEEALKLMDLVYFDLKHMDSGVHEKLTGVGNALILENAVRMAVAHIPMIVRLPLLPGLNDSAENLEQTARFVSRQLCTAIPIEILPYHILGRQKRKALGEAYALGELEPPSADALDLARSILEAAI